MYTGVYTITNLINNKIYIGFAKNINKRWIRHKDDLNNNIHHCVHLQDSWNKYGKNQFLFEVLIECEERFLASEEHYWATLLNVHNENYGYNTRPTHPYGKINQTEETKKKISISNFGKRRTDLERKNMSEKAKLKKDKGYVPWNKDSKGGIVSEEVKLKIKHTMLAKHLKTNNGVGVLKRRPVLQYDLNNNFIKEWESLTEASLYFSGNTCSGINRVCNNKQRKAYNNYWKWK